MRITAAGWARNHGTIEIFDGDMQTVKPFDETHKTFGPQAPRIQINTGPLSQRVVGITLNAFTNLKLTGDYHLSVKLEKAEIAHLYRLTHARELERFNESAKFLSPEEQTDDD